MDGSHFFYGICAIFGASVGFGAFPPASTIDLYDHASYWHPKGPKAAATILRRARRALSPQSWVLLLPKFWASAVSAGLLLGIIFLVTRGNDDLQVGYIAMAIVVGYASYFTGAYFISLRKKIKEYRQEVAKLGAKMVARLGERNASLQLLQEVSNSKDPMFRIASAVGFAELGELEHLPVLEKLSTDQDKAVVDSAVKAVLALQKLLITTPLSVKEMEKLTTNHRKLETKRLGNSNVSSNVDYEDYYQRTQKIIEDIVVSQTRLRHAFPDLYCRECYARAEQFQYEEWVWVRCVQCQDVLHLVPGIVEAIGQIGALSDWQLVEGVLRVNLWDEAKRQARNATISSLEIVGGKAMDYDWAVSAVVEKLNNENPGFGKAIQVRLVNAPPLSSNSLSLLRNLDPVFQDSE